MEWITKEKLILWIMSLMTSVAGVMVFLFSTFQTSAEANKAQDSLEKRLDRIEKKTDLILIRWEKCKK